MAFEEVIPSYINTPAILIQVTSSPMVLSPLTGLNSLTKNLPKDVLAENLNYLISDLGIEPKIMMPIGDCYRFDNGFYIVEYLDYFSIICSHDPPI